MLYKEYINQFPTGKIDYEEWIVSPEGYNERYLRLLQQKEELEYDYQKEKISQHDIEKLESYYQEKISSDFSLNLIPWFIQEKKTIMEAIYEKGLTSFLYFYGGNKTILFLEKKEVPIDKEMFYSIIETINKIDCQSEDDFIEASKLLDRQSHLLSIEDKLNLVEKSISSLDGVTYYIKPPTMISLLVHAQSTEKEVIEIIANHPAATANNAHPLFTDILSQHPNISKEFLIKSFRSERFKGDSSVKGIQRLISEFDLTEEQVIKSIIAVKQAANPDCSMPNLPKNTEELVLFASEELQSSSIMTPKM